MGNVGNGLLVLEEECVDLWQYLLKYVVILRYRRLL